MAVVEVQN